MKNLQFPIKFSFKITTLSNDFVARDATGNTVAYVRQKMLKFKEDIEIFNDESRTTVNYRIKADRWIDFNAAYAFYDNTGTEFGKILRKGWRSLWKSEYELVDEKQEIQYHIREDNAWIKVVDALLGEIPILGWFTGYFFNPSYSVTDLQNQVIVRLKKQPSFFGREFEIQKFGEMDNDDDDRIMLGLMMMILLERRRG